MLAEENWSKIWENRNCSPFNTDNEIMPQLLEWTGYDNVHTDDWEQYVWSIMGDIQEETTILDIGVGAGAFIYPLLKKKPYVYGIDISKKLLDIAKLVIPSGNFEKIQAHQIKGEQKFDIVLAISVFQYFPDYDYASKVMAKIYDYTKKGGRIIIGDVSDPEQKDLLESKRKKMLGKQEYNRRYKVLSHLSYKLEFFRGFLKKEDEIIIKPNILNGYINSGYRYNVFIQKS